MQQTHEFLEKMARTTDKDVQRQQHIGDFYDHFHTIFSNCGNISFLVSPSCLLGMVTLQQIVPF